MGCQSPLGWGAMQSLTLWGINDHDDHVPRLKPAYVQVPSDYLDDPEEEWKKVMWSHDAL